MLPYTYLFHLGAPIESTQNKNDLTIEVDPIIIWNEIIKLRKEFKRLVKQDNDDFNKYKVLSTCRSVGIDISHFEFEEEWSKAYDILTVNDRRRFQERFLE